MLQGWTGEPTVGTNDASCGWKRPTLDAKPPGELAAVRTARFSSLLEPIPADRRQSVVVALTLLVEAAHEHPDRH